MSIRAWLVGFLVLVYRPIERIALEWWATKNITLGSKESIDNSGPYRRGLSIYAPRILDEFMNDPQWRTLVIQKSSQSGLTLHVLILICRAIAEMAMNVLYVIDTLPAARDISKKRLQPMLSNCRATKDLVVGKSANLKSLDYDFPEASLWLVGSNSVGAVANKTAGLIACDELDKYRTPKKESSIWYLACNRMKQVEGGKALGYSSPTWETAETHQGFISGSQHRYFVPCPRCSVKSVITWDYIRFDHCKDHRGEYDHRRVLDETYLECKECGGRIEEDHKLAMMLDGEVRPTNFKEVVNADGSVSRVPGWGMWEMSFQISDLYSLHPNSTWGIIAVEFLKAQGKRKALQDWTNGRMGEPIRHSVSNITEDLVKKLIAPHRGKPGYYIRKTLPVMPAIAVGAIDSQGGFKKWAMGAFLPNGTLYVVDWGMASTMEDAELKLGAAIEVHGGRQIFVQRTICDEGGAGGNTWQVREFCESRFPRFFPSKGRGGVQVMSNTVWWVENKVFKGGDVTMPVCHYDDDSFKSIVYLQRIKKHSDFKSERLGKPRIWLPNDTPSDFLRELCGDQLVKAIDDNGNETLEWKTLPPNDWGDCIKMMHVLWNNIGHKFQSETKPGEDAKASDPSPID